MLEREPVTEGAAHALEKAIMFTLDAYSHSGLVSDDEIIEKLQGAARQFKRKAMLDSWAPNGIEAYVLLNCDLGFEDKIIKELIAIPEVSEVKGIFGVYDFVVKLSADTEENIKTAIAKVRSIDMIKSSLTMMVINHQIGNRVP